MTGSTREAYASHLLESHHASSRDYDQAILTLSAGTLALSVTFVNNIAPDPAPGSLVYLQWAWIALGAAILSVVLSYLTSQWLVSGLMAHLEDETPPGRGRVELVTIGLNLAAFLGLFLGLALLGFYAFTNIGGTTGA